VKRATLALLALALACTRSAADHEELGDRDYAAGAFADALAEYRLGLRANAGSASLHAKAAAAGLRLGDFSFAAAEYRELAAADHSRSDEAADGLERVVRAAIDGDDRLALAAALTALRAVAPNRPLGRYARLVALDAVDRGDTTAALAFLPVAIASAGDGRVADSLLYLYGMTALRVGDCSTAVAVFEGVVRRQRVTNVVDQARAGVGQCALVQGQQALAAGHPADAENWFRMATAPGVDADVARAGHLGLGDVALAQGDVSAAIDHYQQALIGGTPGDSITVKAREKLNTLGKADTAGTNPS
jgi:tetratricopeptide (TPR) repeat protein